jgi:hypothetical protein
MTVDELKARVRRVDELLRDAQDIWVGATSCILARQAFREIIEAWPLREDGLGFHDDVRLALLDALGKE